MKEKRSKKCTFTEFHADKRKIPPIIVEFEHAQVDSSGVQDLEFGVFKDKQAGARVVAARSQEGVLYVSRTAVPHLDVCRTLLAVKNKQTNKVRLYVTESVLLSPVLSVQNKPTESTQEETSDFAELQRKFGSKRNKVRQEQYERTTMGVDVLQEQLTGAISESTQLAEELPSTDALTLDFLPPCNRNALSVSEVYQLQNLVPDNVMSEVIETMSGFVEQSEVEASSPFFAHVLSRIGEASEQVAVLRFVEGILATILSPGKQLHHRLNRVFPENELVCRYLRKNFITSDDSGMVSSQRLKDKAICHVIVIGLLLCGHRLDLKALAASIRLRHISVKYLFQLSRLLGAQSLSDDTVVLRVPVPPLPAVSWRTTQKRKK